MNVVALMIGRGGSSLQDKNILPVLGAPLLHWAAAAARRSRYVSRFYISSDCPRILATAGDAGYLPIERPAELASATAQSSDAVRHAFEIIEREGPVDILVVQHANVGTISAAQIDACVELLLATPEASSVVPAHQHPEYHPMRAKWLGANGGLVPVVRRDAISANRQDLPACFFFDHSFWVLRGRTAVFDPNGQQPWPCMGSHILPYETQGCRDVHDLSDLKATEDWIVRNGIEFPQFSPLHSREGDGRYPMLQAARSDPGAQRGHATYAG